MEYDAKKARRVTTLVEDQGPKIDTSCFPPAVSSGTVATYPIQTAYQPEPTFREELKRLLNRKCQENASNTPDFILAEYLLTSLEAFNVAVNAREDWYGIQLAPSSKNVVMRQPRRG